MSFYVRIKPHLACDNYNEFVQKTRWYDVGKAKADWCREARLHDLSPEAPLVFDVCTPEQARAIDEAEQKRAAPAGTVQAPIVIPDPPAHAAAAAPPGDGGGGDDGNPPGKDQAGKPKIPRG
jgi:hypothetical protein